MSFMDLSNNGLLSFSPISDFEHYDGAPPSYDAPKYSPAVNTAPNGAAMPPHYQQQQMSQQQSPQQLQQSELPAHETKKMMKKLQSELDYQVHHQQMTSNAAAAVNTGAGAISMHHPGDIHMSVNQYPQQQRTTTERFSAVAPGVAEDADTSTTNSGYFSVFWERRRSVLKLMIITLVILLAISLHNTIYFYVCAFIDRIKHRPKWNEVVIRIAYPVVILLVMWHLKAHVVGGSSSL